MFKALINAKIDAQQALINTAIADSRGLTDEEQTKFNDLQKEIDNLEATAELQNKVEARAAEEKKVVNMPIIETKDLAAEKPFKNFGEQLIAIKEAATPGGVIDSRLLRINNATGANEKVPSEGGFLVQTDFVTELYKEMYDASVLAPRCSQIKIGANSNGLKMNGVDESDRSGGSRWGGVQVYTAAEAATVTATKPKFRQIELSLNKVMGLYYCTDELLQDSTATGSIISQAFSDALRFKVDNLLFRGTGAGEPLGILNAGCLVTQDKEVGQANDTVLFENILNMWSRLIAGSRPNAAWLINQEIEPQLYTMSFSSGVSAVPVYMPANGISGAPYGTLFGKPVIPFEQASALGDVGDISLVDMNQYLFADKGNMQMATSMHVQFIYDEMAFRVTYRMDGQPYRRSAITPYKGSKTLSSFVTLQAR